MSVCTIASLAPMFEARVFQYMQETDRRKIELNTVSLIVAPNPSEDEQQPEQIKKIMEFQIFSM